MSNSLADDVNTLSEYKPDNRFTVFSDGKGCLYIALYDSFNRVQELLSFADYGEGVLLDACVEIKKGNQISGYGDRVSTKKIQNPEFVVIAFEGGLFYNDMDLLAIKEFDGNKYHEKINFVWGV